MFIIMNILYSSFFLFNNSFLITYQKKYEKEAVYNDPKETIYNNL